MAKSVKSIQQEMNKNLSRREASRLADNYRKSLRRQLARQIEAQTGVKVKANKGIENYAANIKLNKEAKSTLKEIQSSYAAVKPGTKQKVGYNYDVRKAAQTQAKKSPGYTATLARKNRLFTHQINQASKVGGISTLSKSSVKGFYGIFSDVIRGSGDSRNFNKVIMNKAGERDLEKIYNLVTKEKLDYKEFDYNSQEEFNKYLEEINENIDLFNRREAYQKYIDSLERRYKVGGNTEELQYNGEDEQEKVSSPEEVNAMITYYAILSNA